MEDPTEDTYFDCWLVCPCGCGKHVSIETNHEGGVPAEVIQEIWQDIVAKEGLEQAIDTIFHDNDEAIDEKPI